MSNGNAAIIACCQYGKNGGYGSGSGCSGKGGGLSALSNTSNKPGLLAAIGRAFNNAVHGGDSGFVGQGGGGNLTGAGSGGSGAKVVPFPMVNPFKPVVQTRVPVPGLTAHPRHIYSVAPDGSGIPDDEQFAGLAGFGGDLGFVPPLGTGGGWEVINSGSGSPSTLQTIVGGIQATLPATIQAFRAAPTNIFPGNTYNPYATNAGGMYPGSQPGAGADIGATAGAAAGNVADSFGAIVQRHPYLILGAGAALLLLFMNPPRRGR